MIRARSRELRLGGVNLSTPLLIPSVSSKGFPLDQNGFPESNLLLNLAVDGLDECLLVSAYDLHIGALSGTNEFLHGESSGSALERPRLIIVDSGGYETSNDWESGHIDRAARPVRSYNNQDFTSLVDRLPRERATLIVSYDGPDMPHGEYGEQIDRAHAFFASRGHFASDILLKPPRNERWHTPRHLAACAPDLVGFDVIGFTEKELGNSIMERLTTLVRLRAVLDRAGIDAPLHLFGALDPLLSPLYFAAGAEIFDGLSWLRYVYYNGLAVHPDAGSLLRGEIDDKRSWREAKRVIVNLGELAALRRRMQRHANSGRYEEFGPHADVVADTIGTLIAIDEMGER